MGKALLGKEGADRVVEWLRKQCCVWVAWRGFEDEVSHAVQEAGFPGRFVGTRWNPFTHPWDQERKWETRTLAARGRRRPRRTAERMRLLIESCKAEHALVDEPRWSRKLAGSSACVWRLGDLATAVDEPDAPTSG